MAIDQQDLEQRIQRAIQAMEKMKKFTQLPGLYDHQLGGDAYQAAIERRRVSNAKIEDADFRHNETIQRISQKLKACESVDEVWKFIVKELMSALGAHADLQQEGGGINWEVAYQLVREIPYEIRPHFELTADCLRTIYRQFWK